jgi:hypothetical protein
MPNGSTCSGGVRISRFQALQELLPMELAGRFSNPVFIQKVRTLLQRTKFL